MLAVVSRRFSKDICPFCCKLKAFLNWQKIPYTATDVNPMTKSEIAFSKDYRKVPIAVYKGEQINDSSLILDKLVSDLQAGGKLGKDFKDSRDPEIAKWLEFVDKKLAVLLFPNITRNMFESWEAFGYINKVPHFNMFQKFALRVSGSVAMRLANGKIKKKYMIEDERASLVDAVNQWARFGLKGSKFHGGDHQPDLADVTVYGCLKSINQFTTFAWLVGEADRDLLVWFNPFYIKMGSMQLVTTGLESLSRRISLSGIMSRAEAEKAVKQGLVSVDGFIVSSLCKVADSSSVTVDGAAIPPPPTFPFLYGLIKPRGVICDHGNENGRTFLPDLFAKWNKRGSRALGPRGQTEFASPVNEKTDAGISMNHYIVINKIPITATGIVLLTTDGIFSKNLTDITSKILTTFRVRVGYITDLQIETIRKWKTGVGVAGIDFGPVFIDVEKRIPTQSWLKVRLVDAPGRDLKNLFWYRAGIHVNRINCYAFGPYKASEIPHAQIIRLPILDSIHHLVPKRDVKPTLLRKLGS